MDFTSRPRQRRPTGSGCWPLSPDNTAAIHYYIHATEFVGEAPKALPYAEKLARLAPEASHLVHMGAHTLMHVGRYEDVAVVNAAAIATDARFGGEMGYKRPLGQAFYYGHNFSFGLAGAMMAGDRDLTLKYVDHAPVAFPTDARSDRRAGLMARTYVAARPLRSRPEPWPRPRVRKDSYILKAMRHYARGEALAANGDADRRAGRGQGDSEARPQGRQERRAGDGRPRRHGCWTAGP